MATLLAPNFSIHAFLAEESSKDLLRFSTAGSVDDGKSTLIGRLLYDTQSVYEDQVRSIEGKGTTAPGQIDFALLTDGLRAEREQGITIDVAYRYFSTARRKFIIADTPGHEQYTRNMATGASTADAAVVLIDARKGVLEQSRRHAYIASLLRVQSVIVAVNKMDLVNFDSATYNKIEQDFKAILDQIATETGNPVDAFFIPVSALQGDNIVHRSRSMPWYQGPSLLERLESVPSLQSSRAEPFRFTVQRVLRPDLNFRGFAGQVASGTIKPGDKITVLPSNRTAKIARIVTYDGDLDQTQAPQSVTLTLDRELDISRGDLIVASQQPASVVKQFNASLVWMNQQPLELNRRYLLKHTSQTVPVSVSALHHRINISTLSREPANTLEMNQIGAAIVTLLRPIAVDLYKDNRTTGAFILIDAETNGTVAAGMITGLSAQPANANYTTSKSRVTPGERATGRGHRGGAIYLNGPVAAIDAIERSLFNIGAATLVIDTSKVTYIQSLDNFVSLGIQSGLLVIVATYNEDNPVTARISDQVLSLDNNDPATAIHDHLLRAEILLTPTKAKAQ